MSEQPPWDPWKRQGPPEYPPQQPYGQQPYDQQAYPPGQPTYGQQDPGQYQDQPRYRRTGQQPSRPSSTPNPQYGATPGQSLYQGQPQYPPGSYGQQPYPQEEPPYRQQPPGAPSGPPPGHRRKRRGPRTALWSVAALAVVIIGASVALAEGHGHPATTAATSSVAATTTSPASCKQQYDNWRTGPARSVALNLTSALTAVQTAGNDDDLPALAAGLHTAGTDAAALAQYPMPACADPGGYWPQTLARVKAAGDDGGNGANLTDLLAAEAALKPVPGLESKLTAELKRTT